MRRHARPIADLDREVRRRERSRERLDALVFLVVFFGILYLLAISGTPPPGQ